MRSAASAINAPAEAAWLSIHTHTGIRELSSIVRIESAAATTPPYVFIWITTRSAPISSACARHFPVSRSTDGMMSSRIGKV